MDLRNRIHVPYSDLNQEGPSIKNANQRSRAAAVLPRHRIFEEQPWYFLCQKKYVLDILQETGLLESKPADTPLDTSIKLVPDEGEQLVDQSKYKRIVGKLIYLTITRPEASLCKTKDSHIGELLQGFYF